MAACTNQTPSSETNQNDDDHQDMPPLHGPPSTSTGMLGSASDQPIVVAFECCNTSDVNQQCIICFDVLHEKTNEIIRLSKCCHCAIHLTCVYQWLSSQHRRGLDKDNWSCPHCRAPVKNLTNNNNPCVICGAIELRAAYHEPIAQSIPCCEKAVHQQCLYAYITANHKESYFPCPNCGTILSASRSVALNINAVSTDIVDWPFDVPTPPTPPSTPPSTPPTSHAISVTHSIVHSTRRRSNRLSRPRFPRGQPSPRLPYEAQ